MFIVFSMTLNMTNPKSITVTLSFRFLGVATSEYFYLDIRKPPHIWHARNLTQLTIPLNPDLFSFKGLPYLSEWYYHTHLIVLVTDLGVISNPSLSLAQIIPQSQWLLSHQILIGTNLSICYVNILVQDHISSLLDRWTLLSQFISLLPFCSTPSILHISSRMLILIVITDHII